MITLTFSPISTGSQVLVRATFFRICADHTLRGPDSTVVATYTGDTWKLGARSCREFHCNNSVYLRITNADGTRERGGPYELVRAAEGALFTNGRCLGTYSPKWNAGGETPCWQEVALLSSIAAAS